MGRQESPPPRQRHRVPHHRHHHHHRDHHNHHDNYLYSQAPNRKSALSLGKLNRESHALDSHAAVESWLGGVTAPTPATRAVSPESRNQFVQHRKRPRSRDRCASPYRQHPGRIDPFRRPLHIPLGSDSLSPRPPPPANFEGKSKRYERDGSGSSLIGALSTCRGRQERSHTKSVSELERNSNHDPLNGAEVEAAGVSSPASYGSVTTVYEKRPRRKTRVDKYDIKGSKNSRKYEKGVDRAKGARSRKRRRAGVGKNVMNNFTSQAVLKDRITVQPNMRPGLFENMRAPKRQTVTDLSFSDMPLPIHRERDVSQQKGLSGSRLKELRRESRELEQISSFFIPSCATGKRRGLKTAKADMNGNIAAEKPIYEDPTARTASPAPSQAQSRRQPPFQIQTNLNSAPTTALSDICYRPGSSQTTAYMSWSDSQATPSAKNGPVSTQSKPMELVESKTPESIRRALAATGVFEEMGICSHDTLNSRPGYASKESSEPLFVGNDVTNHKHSSTEEALTLNRKPGMDLGRSNDTASTMTVPIHLEDRWNIILPPEWRKPCGPSVGELSREGTQQDAISKPLTKEGPIDRLSLAQEARLKPPEKLAKVQNTHSDEDQNPSINTGPTTEAACPVIPEGDQPIGCVGSFDEPRDKIASRDAMPPPPLPHHIDSNAKDISYGYEAHTGISTYETPQETNRFKATGEPRELTREPEKMIPPLDSASWIPQAVTSGIASYERDKTLSRLSMRSSIYDAQSKGSDFRASPHPTPPEPAHMIEEVAEEVSESMADFIARIESELEEPASPSKCYQSKVSTENQGNHGQTMITYGTQDWHPSMLNWPSMDCYQHLVSEPDPRLGEAFEEGYHHVIGHGNSTTPTRDMSTITLPIEETRNNPEEFLEMSSFWRPNRFSQF